ncbi:hypothetical protein C5167_037999 [Papaver somniferum]|uniref:UDP-glycosyltransferases domain-containing protein n=1 Tax=Papaver somniferum TaxID=3469 RepID=A0A4Y7IAJ3_PAPSO|nr:hypothetical protein C5167_037999 [Papaver somniferum]
MEEILESLHSPYVIIFPSPGMGHVIPLTEFAKRLALNHGISITFAVPTEINPPSEAAQKSVLDSLPGSINTIFLSPVDLSDLPNGATVARRTVLTVTRSLSSLFDSLKTISSSYHVVALVVDIFSPSAVDLAKEFNIIPYIFFPSTAMCLSLYYYLPVMDQVYSCEYRDVAHPIQIPGCVPVWGTDLTNPLEDRKSEAYRGILQYWRRINMAAVYPIGRCLNWLDNQPLGSVLFTSFGSVGTLSNEQLTELASGVEMSEHKFLWVLRSPTDKSADANYLNSQSVRDPFELLPKGFSERTKMTEQKMNAVMLTDDLKVALRPKVNKNGIIGRDEISRCVKGVMEGGEGIELRSRMGDLKGAATSSLSEGGSSCLLRWQTSGKIIRYNFYPANDKK